MVTSAGELNELFAALPPLLASPDVKLACPNTRSAGVPEAIVAAFEYRNTR